MYFVSDTLEGLDRSGELELYLEVFSETESIEQLVNFVVPRELVASTSLSIVILSKKTRVS